MRAFRLDYFSDAPSAVRTLKLTDLKATLKLFTRDVSASNVYGKIVPNCRSRNTKTRSLEIVFRGNEIAISCERDSYLVPTR